MAACGSADAVSGPPPPRTSSSPSLLGVFCGLKALGYWLDRYGLVLGDHKISNFSFTGLTYAGEHAVLPGRTILLLISLVCALLFFANVARRTWLLPGLGLAILVLASVLLGWLWPAIVQQFQVRPNEPDRESTFIGRNIDATRSAFGLGSSEVTQYSAKTTATAGQLRDDAEAVPGIRLMDPTLVSESFEQLQQVRGFYAFPRVLDVDRYQIGGKTQDAVVAVREVDLTGLPSAQRNWNNDHTVFTHGYGLVSAFGNRAATNGAPVWMEKDLPSVGDLGTFEQRIYFGEEVARVLHRRPAARRDPARGWTCRVIPTASSRPTPTPAKAVSASARSGPARCTRPSSPTRTSFSHVGSTPTRSCSTTVTRACGWRRSRPG